MRFRAPAERSAGLEMSDESFSTRCRRVLENGPASEDDYEAACYLIGQGLADGVCGQPSKGRDTYGKITKVFWRCPTAAGRLWLEQQSEHERLEDRLHHPADDGAGEQGSEKSQGRKNNPPTRESWLIVLAITVAGAVLAPMVILLIKTHLGIAL